MVSLDTKVRAEPIPPWFVNDLTGGARELLRECLATWLGTHATLQTITFGDAETILRAARRIAIAESDPREWEIELLYQLKRLLER